MVYPKNKSVVVLAAAALAVGLTVFFVEPFNEQPVDYSSEIKPMLNRKCISCHGGVRQKGGFSLLFREEALDTTESGKFAIVPGHPGKSEMIRRITLDDPDERMPYKHDRLSEEEIDLLTRWVDQGAKWGEHWSYVAVKDPAVPNVDDAWARNDIDKFIFEKLAQEKIRPSADADPATLIRRVSLDLTGLPPDEKLAQSFLADPTNENYERTVDALLSSPAYGERWTSMWMDLARYADSKGYEKDSYRNVWKYRDWLISAFNNDMPYDQFLTAQIAGDLLPAPTDEQLIATAFHRNTMTNDEGGTDSEEFRTAAVLDRVNTTWQALMGTTFACAQCHSHPYDPIKHKEYFQFMAFFNNTRDEDTNGDYPLLRQYKGEDSLKFLKLKNWLQSNVPAEKAREQLTFVTTLQPAYNSLFFKPVGNAVTSESGLLLKKDGGAFIRHVYLSGKTKVVFNFYTGQPNGQLTLKLDNESGKTLAVIPIAKQDSWQTIEKEIAQSEGYHDVYVQYTNPKLKDLDESGMYFDWFHFDDSFPGEGKPDYQLARMTSWELVTKGKFTSTPIMMENPNFMFRPSHVFERGSWLVKGEEVQPGVPAVFNPMPANAPRNRLGLAQWLTDLKNPLVSRTMVNRLWEQLFGYGIVETVEDLGSQGIAPTHQALLDHLSWKLMTEYRWSMKKLLREIVMSSTYRQDSKTTPLLSEKDPYNKLLARGPRVRLTAEQIRDQGLFVSGLLSKKMYGPSVMPYQPKGIWHSPYSAEKWELSKSEDQYRRALYTHWKRTAPYPSMLTFDGAAREVCTSRRIRTNTPLQALVTLNDSSYVEMAAHLAKSMKEYPGDVDAKISQVYKQMMYKPITKERLAALTKLYYRAMGTDELGKPVNVATVNNRNGQQTESLAYLVVVNALMNMDEWITKN